MRIGGTKVRWHRGSLTHSNDLSRRLVPRPRSGTPTSVTASLLMALPSPRSRPAPPPPIPASSVHRPDDRPAIRADRGVGRGERQTAKHHQVVGRPAADREQRDPRVPLAHRMPGAGRRDPLVGASSPLSGGQIDLASGRDDVAHAARCPLPRRTGAGRRCVRQARTEIRSGCPRVRRLRRCSRRLGSERRRASCDRRLIDTAAGASTRPRLRRPDTRVFRDAASCRFAYWVAQVRHASARDHLGLPRMAGIPVR
jgi:hypothetical protein